MAENAHYYIELLNDDLYALTYSPTACLSPSELKALSSTISSFEHKLQRRIGKPQDYTAYATFFTNLSSLISIRKNDNKSASSSSSSKAQSPMCTAKISQIWSRATRRFPANLSLWLERIHFCLQTHQNKALEEIFATALQLHPLATTLWRLAACWEAEHNLNMPAARLLIQRALRLCKGAEGEVGLWAEIFRLELVYWHKIAQRQEVLGVEKRAEGSKMLQIVADHALESVQGAEERVKLFSEFLQLASEYEGEGEIRDHLLNLLALEAEREVASSLSPSLSAAMCLTLYQWNSTHKDSQLFFSLVDALCKSNKPNLLLFALQFSTTHHLSAADLQQAKRQIFQAAQDCIPFSQSELWTAWLQWAQEHCTAERLVEIAELAVENCPSECALWKQRIALAEGVEGEVLLEKALTLVSAEDSHSLRTAFLDCLNEREKEKGKDQLNTQSPINTINSSIESHAKRLMLPDYSIPVLHWYLIWLHGCQHLPKAQIRIQYQQLARDWRTLCAFWNCCLAFERAHFNMEAEDLEYICTLWTTKIECDPQQLKVNDWIEQVRWLAQEAGDWMRAAHLATKAGQRLAPEDAAVFLQAYTAMKAELS